ncbi:MAG: isoprenylcysteine carboxylmethyltransferase family protein [Ignavibacteriaceae bacterium]|jgi:protein-S-isoprenylcysteine O-methyltransferase Ste14|nr:isoprenylcysteine carboxylmethyltransferase family protein [Ignavibacteriaceae bacterium]MCW8813275.1 isoprenylcysteine carboxylmethyltransferase family protein [Chlorobium sp.]MCW8823046.1 isoprenylcysteine carboxylmethyltransferase family protein [Ignavibacteriaceae bacterium]MCW9097482.1 isoprenylcysteine carboxylmethyltransferase family protein [Ignavibacteriaceae bacterium]
MNTLLIIQISVFVIVSIFLIVISWQYLYSPTHHGFYRFFAFEYIVILVIINAPFWFLNPFSLLQIISWLFLVLSLFVVLPGFYILKKKGEYKKRNIKSANYEFEDTVNLVDTGIYKYIRHPMYSSLLLLVVGALFKNLTIIGIVLTILAVIFITLTAKIEERENLSFFGSAYKEYMKKTRMFFPYLY